MNFKSLEPSIYIVKVGEVFDIKIPHVLILYGNYGAGHKRAADAIEEKLKASLTERDSVVIYKKDFLGENFTLIDGIMKKLYIQSFHWMKPLYKKLYYKTKDLPIDSSVTSLFTYLGSKKLEKYLQEVKADIVISTFPALTGMLSQIKKRNQTQFKLCCLLTDYTTHNHWLYQHVDHYFVPTEQIKKEFIERGIPEETIQATGIPVMNQFETKKDVLSLKDKFHLDHEKPIVLISAGAFGVTNLKDVCLKMNEKYPQCQFIVVCGRNKKLYNVLSKVEGITALGYTDKMDELLKVSDLYITKAGGLSITEAIATETPMLLYGSLPGQELENVIFLTSQNVARQAETEEDLILWIDVIFGNKQKMLESMRSSIGLLNQTISHSERWLETVQTEYY
jgi:processive 1,2-diacylglycerol beta-glucosyltransferase